MKRWRRSHRTGNRQWLRTHRRRLGRQFSAKQRCARPEMRATSHFQLADRLSQWAILSTWIFTGSQR
jgi:hypothetical protein